MIIAKNIYKKYGTSYALQNINFEFNGGKMAVLGYNGAGKSTLAKLIVGIIKPTRGLLKVFGESPSTSPRVRKKIGIASHNPMLYKDLSVRENLEFFSRLYGSHIDIEKVVELLGLEKYINKRVSELSRGYLQRVTFAKALVNDPELLVLDEITSGLDVSARENILEMLKKFNGSVIFTTHVFDEARFCDCFLVLKFGEIIYFGEKFDEAVEILNESSN